MEWTAKWIKPSQEMGDVCPVFEKTFSMEGEVKNAQLFLTGLGAYEAVLNGRRAGIRTAESAPEYAKVEIAPVDAKITITQKSRFVPKGTYIFYAPRKETL